MTYYYEGTDNVVAGTAVAMASLDFLYIAENVTVGSSNGSSGVTGVGAEHVNVAGSLISVGGYAFDDSGGGNRIVIGTTGTVSGGLAAMHISAGFNHISNAGTIMGEAAIDLGSNENNLLNSGQILSSYLVCIQIDGGNNVISNSGSMMAADDTCISFSSSLGSDAVNTIDNSGTISAGGGYAAFIGGNAPANFINSGHVYGDIDFGNSADIYDGSLGNHVGVVNGGAGNDTLTGGSGRDDLQGGAGLDLLEGGGGHDHFIYSTVTESNGHNHDTIADFDARRDVFDLNVAVAGIDATVATGLLRSGHFVGDMQTAIGASALAPHDAVLFTPDAGNLAGHTILAVDADGVAGFSAMADYAFDITNANNLNQLSTDDFI